MPLDDFHTLFKRGEDYIGVSVVFFCHDGEGNYLLGRRSANCRDEIGRWDPGGGAIEFGESPDEAVKREIEEEYGTLPIHLDLGGVRNVLRHHNGKQTHWVALVYHAQIDPNCVKNSDPHKIEVIDWFSPNQWPSPLHSQFEASFAFVRK
jgi:8-oxo-dGTP pyrophosphatase MutT (NUDIX family)